MIYLELFLTFFKIGLFTIGGGYAMLPLIQTEVLNKNWLSEKELINFIAVSESTPGAFAVNISTYIGVETAGIPGAICATLGLVLPSFIIILVVARFFIAYRNNKIVNGVMVGLRPAVIALIFIATLSIAKIIFFSRGLVFDYELISSVIIFAVMIILIIKKINPKLIILFSALMGIVLGYIQ